jgi:hypothetical protein
VDFPVTCRAVVTDLDGTIVRDDGSVSAATLTAAEQLRSRGIPLVAATARTPAGIRVLETLRPYLAVAVCCGGALGASPADGRTLWRDDLAPASVDLVVRLVAGWFPAAGVAAYDGRRWLMTPDYAATRGAAPRGPSTVVPLGALTRSPACAMAVCHPDLDAGELARGLTSAGLDGSVTVTWSGLGVVDIMAAGVDKYTGVSRALDRLAVPAPDTVVFGDMPNDLPMFRLCGYRVAMGNAHPEVRAAADAVARSVDDDGFAAGLADLRIIGTGPDRIDLDSPGNLPGEG